MIAKIKNYLWKKFHKCSVSDLFLFPLFLPNGTYYFNCDDEKCSHVFKAKVSHDDTIWMTIRKVNNEREYVL